MPENRTGTHSDAAGHLARARQALAQGDPGPAGAELGTLLARDPEHLEARLLMLHTARLTGRDVAADLDRLLEHLEARLPDSAPVLLEALRMRIIQALQAGRHPEALRDLQRAVELDPASGELLQACGALLNEAGRFAEARPLLERAQSQQAGQSAYWTSLALALQGTGERAGAEAAFRRAASLAPDSVPVLFNLARFLAEAGRIPDTAPLLDRILRVEPGNPAAVSGLLMTGLYDPGRTPAELARLHRAWAESLEAKVAPVPFRPLDWNPERRLTVAYLSADFREHSCAAFLEPLLGAHDRTRHRILLVTTVPQRDARTDRFQGLSDGWIEGFALDDAGLLERLRDEGVDVLVDLGGHSGYNRVSLLARRPAPVQVGWLGYPFTTGFSRLEGRVTDARVDPPGSEALGSEPLLRLDPCYLCWQPPADGPGPREDSDPGAPFTFGSFNHFAKLNGAVIETWAAILRRAPGSRLLLKGRGSQDAVLRERILEGFSEQGVPAGRVLLEGWREDPAGHLGLYRSIDLALDPFPYNGVTTTVEALWMGVPVVALRGVHSLSRQGFMLLATVGLEELATGGPAEYVATAAALAADPQRLGRLRSGLRERLLASPLCDAAGFARRMEGLYREQWRKACARAQIGGAGTH